MHKSGFSKKIFSLLIEKAKGERTLKQYADECRISYMQMRKLWLCAQENPPRKALVKKLASFAHCGIEYEDFAFAAGFFKNDESASLKVEPKNSMLLNKIEALSTGQRKTVEDFVDFLTNYR